MDKIDKLLESIDDYVSAKVAYEANKSDHNAGSYYLDVAAAKEGLRNAIANLLGAPAENAEQ